MISSHVRCFTGFAQMDPIIIIPNGVGMLLGVIQITLCTIFPYHRQEGRMPLRDESFEEDFEDGFIMMTKLGTNSHHNSASNNDMPSQEEVDVELSDDDLELL